MTREHEAMSAISAIRGGARAADLESENLDFKQEARSPDEPPPGGQPPPPPSGGQPPPPPPGGQPPPPSTLPPAPSTDAIYLAVRPSGEPSEILMVHGGAVREIFISNLYWSADIPESTFSAAFPLARPEQDRPPKHPQ